MLQCDNSMKNNYTLKRGKFIEKFNSLFQEFSFCDIKTKIRIFNIFATSFYGSGLCDIFSKEVDRIFKSWNIAIRIALGVPATTHIQSIKYLSGSPHPRTLLGSRYLKFVNSLLMNFKQEVALLANLSVDAHRAVLGRTLARLRKELDVQVITTGPL